MAASKQEEERLKKEAGWKDEPKNTCSTCEFFDQLDDDGDGICTRLCSSGGYFETHTIAVCEHYKYWKPKD